MNAKMEDRIRFGSDGNGMFVIINFASGTPPLWRLYDHPRTLGDDWRRNVLFLRDAITEADFREAMDHLGARPDEWGAVEPPAIAVPDADPRAKLLADLARAIDNAPMGRLGNVSTPADIEEFIKRYGKSEPSE